MSQRSRRKSIERLDQVSRGRRKEKKKKGEKRVWQRASRRFLTFTTETPTTPGPDFMVLWFGWGPPCVSVCVLWALESSSSRGGARIWESKTNTPFGCEDREKSSAVVKPRRWRVGHASPSRGKRLQVRKCPLRKGKTRNKRKREKERDKRNKNVKSVSEWVGEWVGGWVGEWIGW